MSNLPDGCTTADIDRACEEEPCQVCDGEGWIWVERMRVLELVQVQEDCPECGPPDRGEDDDPRL